MNFLEMQIRLKQKRLLWELKLAKNALKIGKLYTYFLKEEIKLGSKTLEYNSDLNDYYLGNCYTYALGLKSIPEFIDDYVKYSMDEVFPFNPGFMHSTQIYSHSALELLNNFYQDCKDLGIEAYESRIDLPNYHDGYKIVIYIYYLNGINDIHFIRQNEDGSWSHKKGYFGEILQMNEPKPLNTKYKYFKTFEIVRPVILTRSK